MTRRLGRGDEQRGRARLTLLVVTLTAGGLLLGLYPAGPLSSVLAAVNGSPTSTERETNNPGGTTTPASPTAPTIDLLNPSKYVEPIIVSNKHDEDDAYHLVAVVGADSSVPEPKSVVFEIEPGGERITATRIGDTSDTWHAKWGVQQDNDEYTVTARLFTGSTPTQAASDEEDVTVNKAQETVEINYPTNGGALGTFDPDASVAGGNDPEARGFVIDATVSADATGVMVFYGTSPPGTEQNWRECEVQETVSYSGQGSRRIGCTVADDVDENDITAVAAVAEGTDEFDPDPLPNCGPDEIVDPGPPPLCGTIDSGDAHRVVSYDQVPSSLSINPSTVTAAINTCQVLTAILLDNQARPIWRANTDVHATGPTDALRFGRVTGRTRNWQPPDDTAGAHDGEEATSNCGGSGTPPAQAEHNRPDADEKHIETRPPDEQEGGTDTSGGFSFALRSGQPGTTNVLAWYDGNGDDNDVFDSGELSGTATITWTEATPSQSATATASSSPSASPSPSPSRSPSASPSPSRSPSSSPSPTPAARTVTLESSRNSVRFGRGVTFSGIVDSTDPACESGQLVHIQRQATGDAGFSEIGTATTDGSGAYAFTYTPDENASYRAVVDPSQSCQEAISDPSLVGVRVGVSLRASDRLVPKGKKVKLTVKVVPCGDHANTSVTLERKTGRRFAPAGRKGLNVNCKATFKKRVKKSARYRGRWPQQDGDHESGKSRTRKVKVAPRPGRRNF